MQSICWPKFILTKGSGKCNAAGADPGFWNGGWIFSTSIREIREIKYYFNIWGKRKKKRKKGLRKRGVKIHPFHLPCSRSPSSIICTIIFENNPWSRAACRANYLVTQSTNQWSIFIRPLFSHFRNTVSFRNYVSDLFVLEIIFRDQTNLQKIRHFFRVLNC